jgi:hypothetical protein
MINNLNLGQFQLILVYISVGMNDECCYVKVYGRHI